MAERGEGQPPSPGRAERIDFAIERQRHRRFVGRQDALAQLDEWLIGPGEAGWVIVTVAPHGDDLHLVLVRPDTGQRGARGVSA